MQLSSNFFSDHHYVRIVLLVVLSAFVSDSKLSFSCFLEKLSVTFMSKTFVRVWHKSLLSELSAYRFYPSFSILISRFLSGRSTSDIADEYCSTPKLRNSGVSQDCAVTHPLSICSSIILCPRPTALCTALSRTLLCTTPHPSTRDPPHT